MAGRYQDYEKNCPSAYLRRCIDGQTAGSAHCVAYCTFDEHPGFLTAKHCRIHDCLRKQCDYYLPKEPNEEKRVGKQVKKQLAGRQEDDCARLMSIAEEVVRDLEGFRFLSAAGNRWDSWELRYITISNEYSDEDIAARIAELWGAPVHLKRLDYPFDTCIALISKK